MTASLALLVALLSSPFALRPVTPPPPPIVGYPDAPPPLIDAASWAVWSLAADAEIGSSNGDVVRAPASVTKVLTALVVLDRALLDERVTISATADATPIGFVGQPEIKQGEVWTIQELLAFMLVKSGNDAAVALAEHVGGSVEGFATLMNEKAAQLGMESSSFLNPNGLDATGHVTTARDMIRLARAAAADERLIRITSIQSITFDPGPRPPFTVSNTNGLLGRYPGLLGLKTGDTLRAGLVLLSYVETPSDRLVAVVMGSRGHLAATAELVTWAEGAGGPRDHMLAPITASTVVEELPTWLRARLDAVPPLSDGRFALPGRTPAERRLVDVLADLLPAVLGGSP